IQREDLNPIEEADAYDKLMTEFGLTQEQLAETVGKSRPAIANTVRLLLLAEGVKRMIADGSLTSGHARALLGVSDKTKQEEAAAHIVERGFSVRQTEELVKKLSVAQKPAKKKKGKKSTPEIAQLENKLKTYLGTKVRLDAIDQKKGKIVIEYYSLDDIDRIVGLIMKD
ncbi:MAG: ParB/RepB/Spo0J family partition protein, partial [Clostridia bacterium]